MLVMLVVTAITTSLFEVCVDVGGFLFLVSFGEANALHVDACMNPT